jgi:hypothetical protein
MLGLDYCIYKITKFYAEITLKSVDLQSIPKNDLLDSYN